MFVTVDILGVQKAKNGDQGRMMFTAALRRVVRAATSCDHGEVCMRSRARVSAALQGGWIIDITETLRNT